MPVRDPPKGGATRKYDDRLVLDAIFFVLRSCCQWRMIPHDLLPWDAAYRWYRTWSANGTWDHIHDALRDQVRIAAGRDPPSAAVLDAQSIKSSEGGQDRGFDMGKKTTGRKRHLVVDTLGLLLVVMVTAASVQDRPGGRTILRVLAERQVRAVGGTVLRPHLVYGPGDTWFLPTVFRLLSRVPAWIERGAAVASVVSVRDLGAGRRCPVGAAVGPRPGAVFHVNQPEPVTHRELIGTALACLGIDPPAATCPS